MNKINIDNDKIKYKNIDDSIEVELVEKNDFFNVNSIKIKVIKNSDLYINYGACVDIKLDIFIYVASGVELNLLEFKKGNKNKTEYNYYLDDNSVVNVNKFYDCDSVREVDFFNLNGVRSKINYNFRTISKSHEKYDMVIYHNNSESVSNINNCGININDGELIFNVTSVVPNNIKDCLVNQNTRIITFNDNKCSINPNLLIDENDVNASHSAYIGKFRDDELFYLMRLGIPINKVYYLLIKGLLTKNIDINDKNLEEINSIFDKYWG